MTNKLYQKLLSFPPIIYLSCLVLCPIILMLTVVLRVPGDYGGLAPLVQYNSTCNWSLNLSVAAISYLVHSKFIWMIFKRSLLVSMFTTILCLLLGYPLALFITTTAKKSREILLLMVIVPFWSSFLIRIYAWMILLSPDSVVSITLNKLLALLHVAPIDLLFSSYSVLLCLIYINLPFMVLPLYLNLEKHDIALLEASRDLGASKLSTFWRITLPLSIQGILAGCALVFVPCIGMFVVPELIGNNCSLLVGNLIKQQFLQSMNWPLGSITAITMTVLVLLIVGIVAAGARRVTK